MTPTRQGDCATAPAVRPSLWIMLGLVLCLVLVAGARQLWKQAGAAGSLANQPSVLSAPGDYGVVPDFNLKDQSGRAVRLSDLAGRFWVADFIFTRCTGICPTLTQHMRSLAGALAADPDLRFVTFSVDPSFDTPEVLTAYASSNGASDVVAANRWIFLTGTERDLYTLIGKGFRLSVAMQPPGAASAGDLITHSDRFVLVGPDAHIRGYYHGAEEESVQKLREDLKRLRQ